MTSTPILFIIFNRPEAAAAVFNKIREQKPSRLYIAADGPRAGNKDDYENCSLARAAVIDAVDWECGVSTRIKNENAGCGKAVSEAITWFFEHEEYGIILEDDTLPHASFFKFCPEMLEKYRDNPRIMHISGCYFLNRFLPQQKYGWYFTKHIHVWGWATWKRAWQLYDYNMTDWPEKKGALNTYFGRHAPFWLKIFNSAYSKQVDTWDYQWMYAIYRHKGLAVNPTTNLISNIGFGKNGTHTLDESSVYANLPTMEISDMTEPAKVTADKKNDELYYRHFLGVNIKSPGTKFKALKCRINNFFRG